MYENGRPQIEAGKQVFIAACTSHLTPHTSHLTPHTSHLTPHTSHLTPHTSHLSICSKTSALDDSVLSTVETPLKRMAVDQEEVAAAAAAASFEHWKKPYRDKFKPDFVSHSSARDPSSDDLPFLVDLEDVAPQEAGEVFPTWSSDSDVDVTPDTWEPFFRINDPAAEVGAWRAAIN